jgi:hypothetical protein
MLDPSVFKTTRRETFHILLPEAEFLKAMSLPASMSQKTPTFTGQAVLRSKLLSAFSALLSIRNLKPRSRR